MPTVDDYLSVAIPLFLVLWIGNFYGHGWGDPAQLPALQFFLYFIVVPITAFGEVAIVPWDHFLWKPPLLITLGCTLSFILIFLASWWFRGRDNPHYACVESSLSCIPSTLFWGVPFANKMFGRGSGALCILITGLLHTTIVPLLRIVFEYVQDKGKRPKGYAIVLSYISSVLIHPITIKFPLLCGILVSYYGIKLPDVFEVTTNMLGTCASVLSFFILGCVSSRHDFHSSVQGWSSYAIPLVLKLLVVPLFCVAFLLMEYSSNSEVLRRSFMVTALPSAHILERYALKKTSADNIHLARTVGILSTMVGLPYFFLVSPLIKDYSVNDMFLPKELTHQTRITIERFVIVNTLLSMIGTFWIILSGGLFKLLRTYPRRYVLFLALHQLGLAFLLFLRPFFGKTASFQTEQSDAYCYIQGVGGQFFSTTVYIWFLVIAFDFYLIVCLKRRDGARFERYFHILSISFGILTMFLAMLWGKIGPSGPWCWMTIPTWQFVLYYIPMMIVAIVGVYFLLRVRAAVKVVDGEMKASSRSGTKTAVINRKLRRITAFTVAFLSLFLFGALNRLTIDIAGEKGQAIVILLFLHVFCVTGMGVATFVIWGVNEKLNARYAERFRKLVQLCRGCFRSGGASDYDKFAEDDENSSSAASLEMLQMGTDMGDPLLVSDTGDTEYREYVDNFRTATYDPPQYRSNPQPV